MGKEEALLLLSKAEECLNESKALHSLSFYSGAINRAYYSIFNSMQAILQYHDIRVKTHQGAHVQFHQHIIKQGLVTETVKNIPQQIEALRIKGDYEPDHQLFAEDADLAISLANEFYLTIKKYFDAIN